jgi:NhaP-type Na+/H+ or K+/H+ antiporter
MFATWYLICGLLLIAVGLSDTWRQNLPFSTAAIYLVAGYLLGPEMFALISLQLVADAVVLERLTEVAVLISLFAVGLRLRSSLSDPIWRAPIMLATLTMVLTICAVWVFGLSLGLSSGLAMLLAAVLAPTDPVLASDVQVENAQDRDRLRFSLTAEGGLNDGTAFPFVMLALGLLGLHELGPFSLRWWALDVLWATGAALVVGWCLGAGFNRAVMFLRREKAQAMGMESFFTLGLIALSYGLAVTVHAYGFLSVFAAGLAMQHMDRRSRPAEAASDVDPSRGSPVMTQAVLDFTLDLERIAELAVMLVIGSLLTRSAFSGYTLAAALFLICVARPFAVYLTTWRLAWTRQERLFAAWFGIRGIGSLYYLSYAFAHGAYTGQAQFVADTVLVTITLSVLLHGSSATPMMRLYGRARSWRLRR